MNSVAGIVLAAGASSRLGTPKQLVRVAGERLLDRTVRIAIEAGLRPVFGVVSPTLTIEPAPAGMTVVINQEAGEGMASSIRAGVRALTADGAKVSGVVILACDQPAVTAEHVRRLVGDGVEVVASAYGGRKGVPAYFPSVLLHALLELGGDVGARELLRDARAVPLALGELDIDTVQDLERARELYGS